MFYVNYVANAEQMQANKLIIKNKMSYKANELFVLPVVMFHVS